MIEGHGQNHNKHPKDADELARSFVQMLKDAGQSEVRGVFVYGPKLVSSFASAEDL